MVSLSNHNHLDTAGLRQAQAERLGAEILAVSIWKWNYALFAHGYHRATTDIDLLVPATLESGKRIKDALMILPDRAARELDPIWFEEGENIRVADAFVVGLMRNACGESYETLTQFAETVDLDGLQVRTINLEGLLRTKQTMRDKDVSDRIILERALKTYREHSKN